MVRDRLVIEPNPMERTIHESWDFRLEVGEPVERERIDPARAGLVSWKDGLIDHGHAVAAFDKRCCRRRAAGSGANDQDVNSGHAWP